MSRATLSLALAAALISCGGDDEGGGGQPPPGGAAAGGANQNKPDPKTQLIPKKHVEDSVSCPIPDKPTGPQCEPVLLGSAAGSAAAPKSAGAGGGSAKLVVDCDPGRYCLPVGATFSCEPCPERDAIRHPFKDRDFVPDQSRDPFFNYVLMPVGLGTSTDKDRPEPHESCRRPDQFVAGNYSFQDLKLTGIVTNGAQRKVLMLDTAGHGNIIKRGDCVGKEKAVVKDIGAGYITFVVEDTLDSKRPPVETSVQLHPNGLDAEQPEATPDTPAPPVVAPPAHR